jgi:phosphate transport system substrate-binding protein
MRLILTLFFSVVSLCSISTLYAGETETVTFAGSSTILPIMEAMGPVFEEHGINAEIQGGGSSAGFKAAKMGMAQVGMMSRELTEKEAKSLKNLTISKDWVVMIAHSDTPFENVTSEQVIGVYTGEKKELDGWKIDAIAKENGRATKKIFDHYFHLGGKEGHPLDPKLAIIGANGQAISAVANDPHAMSYVSYSAAIRAVEQGEPIQILSLDGVFGTPENVNNGTYKMTRPLNLVYQEKNQDLMDRIRKILKLPKARKVFEANNVKSIL